MKPDLDYEWHHEILEEKHDSLIDCLAHEGIVSIERTENGYKFVECCDSYHGTTLSQSQFERLIAELQELAKAV